MYISQKFLERKQFVIVVESLFVINTRFRLDYICFATCKFQTYACILGLVKKGSNVWSKNPSELPREICFWRIQGIQERTCTFNSVRTFIYFLKTPIYFLKFWSFSKFWIVFNILEEISFWSKWFDLLIFKSLEFFFQINYM